MEDLVSFRTVASYIGDTGEGDADERDLEMARNCAGFDRDAQVACCFDPERAQQIMGAGRDSLRMCGKRVCGPDGGRRFFSFFGGR
jgi:thiamine biosynthesis protein ThiC